MIYVGRHLMNTVGYAKMPEYARSIGADTFAFLTKGGRKKETFAVTESEIAAIGAACGAGRPFGPLVVHAPYNTNLCASDENLRRRHLENLKADLSLVSIIPEAYLNVHPGSHQGDGREVAIRRTVAALEELLAEGYLDSRRPRLLLETVPGKASEIGGIFEDFQDILELFSCPEAIGLCLDTCHLFDGGYDIAADPEKVLSAFDRRIGLEMVKAIHLNDSNYDCGARMDTHERVGHGKIGAEALRYFVTHEKLQGLPFVMETPGEKEHQREEISLVRSWCI